MGFWKKVKKAVKKVGKSVAKTAKKVGQQVKRSTAVAAPILLGPALGEKVGVYVSRTAGRTAKKSTLKGIAKTGRVTGTVVQVAGTAVATYFGGPMAGKAAYAVTGFAKKGGKYIIQKEQYRQGYRTNAPTKPNILTEIIGGIGSILGGGAKAPAAQIEYGDGGGGGYDGPGGSAPAPGGGGSWGDTGSPGYSGGGGGGGGGLDDFAGSVGMEPDKLKGALIVGALLLAAWFMTKGK